MAYDGYQPPPNSGFQGNMNTDSNDIHGYTPTPPYPSYYESDHITMPQPQMPPASSAPPPQNYEYPEPPRPGNNTNGHINDAVNSAVYNNANSNSYLSPEVLSQITSTVIQQLKASGMSDLQSPSQTTPTQFPPQPPPRPQSQSQAQQPWMAPPNDLPLRPQSESPTAPLHQRSGSIPPPSAMSSSFETPKPQPQPQPYSGYSSDTRSNPKTSPEPMPRRTSMSSQGSVRADTRPKPPDRDTTVMEMTTLERIWGKLFEDDKPTARLGQFLRGIAMHLIEDYPPGNTLVIVPQKLQKFYKDTDVSPDAYPWHDIFDDHTSSISRLFREVKAEHHLVQTDDLTERPDIPGLTPKGFEKWATLMILAHPDREYERLQKAVLNMPISNPDDKKERFPKEIPRRLFPEVADLKLREATELHIMKHCGVDLPRITDEERSRANRPKASPPVGSGRSSGVNSPRNASKERSRSYERGRPPPSASSSTAVLDDEDESIPPAPIERERKPYSANPGGGKVYDELGNTRSHRDSFTTRPSDIPPASSSHRVSASTKPRSPTRDSLYAQRSGSGPAPYPRHSKRHSRSSRSSSRSMDGYRHSESDLLGRDHTPRYGNASTNDIYMEPTAMSTEAEDSRYHGSHRNSRTDEDYYRGLLGGQGGAPKYY
ncbi:hypothetical protein N7494_006037 [Penicillium frequentans]|uniref:DUF7514 domain-containing protein n=1 Tax=Penicillium frequentans TaxID=3151616 RepID=A0AAD6GG67_9EURO|nr:hypothetical protein N7494_006037 [Penicillium glabrum]